MGVCYVVPLDASAGIAGGGGGVNWERGHAEATGLFLTRQHMFLMHACIKTFEITPW